MRLADLNALDAEAAADLLLRCCGSTRWARQMAAARPFADIAAMAAAGDAVWLALQPSDWLEAFAAHPKIGETGTLGTGQAGRATPAGQAGPAEVPRGAG